MLKGVMPPMAVFVSNDRSCRSLDSFSTTSWFLGVCKAFLPCLFLSKSRMTRNVARMAMIAAPMAAPTAIPATCPASREPFEFGGEIVVLLEVASAATCPRAPESGVVLVDFGGLDFELFEDFEVESVDVALVKFEFVDDEIVVVGFTGSPVFEACVSPGVVAGVSPLFAATEPSAFGMGVVVLLVAIARCRLPIRYSRPENLWGKGSLNKRTSRKRE